MIKAKKSLGQNFLRDEAVIEKIIELADLKSEELVLEVGPGEGVLTEKLSEKAGKVLAVELDDRLIEMLRSKFTSTKPGEDGLPNKKNVEIIHADILKINLPELVENKIFSKNGEAKNYKVVANIPYYITAPIIRLFLETKYPPQEMILMVQKEVAERICAKPGEMSILAVSVQYYATPEYLFEVSKKSFDPSPKVDSVVIRISLSEMQSMNEESKKFFQIVKAGFSAKRKTLANNLSASLHKDKKEVEGWIEEIGFSKNTRAQELAVADWKKLVSYINPLLTR